MPTFDYLVAPGDIRIAADRLYHRDHYWILQTAPGRGHYRLGLSAYVCRPGIEVYFVENLALPGTVVSEGGLLGIIETEKAVVSLYSPISCHVHAVNQEVLEDPNRISFDNYGVWIVEIVSADSPPLLSPSDYLLYLQSLPPPQCFRT
ncbi:MAG: glycine cleavage system protein H [Gemmatales bacterium]|nr:glycine cleavage system protein H [Gemmatales bacterium]MCS7160769.1 glycine cleavage system protein H [Gemmatales bacterium]MDW8175970.1 glycine cleavage system protein H [Gemmatales bacterium]MDW8222337.1 glycine cleavage system protein H [Gemmatales bacterium]